MMERVAGFVRAGGLESSVNGPGSDSGCEPGLEMGVRRDGSASNLPCTKQASTSGPKRCVNSAAPLR